MIFFFFFCYYYHTAHISFDSHLNACLSSLDRFKGKKMYQKSFKESVLYDQNNPIRIQSIQFQMYRQFLRKRHRGNLTKQIAFTFLNIYCGVHFLEIFLYSSEDCISILIQFYSVSHAYIVHFLSVIVNQNFFKIYTYSQTIDFLVLFFLPL